MKSLVVTAPAREPLTLTAVKDHLRIDLDFNEQDELIEDYIKTARMYVENLTGRKFITQSWKFYMSAWPNADFFYVPYPPLISITSIKYKDSDETEYTFDSGSYLVDTTDTEGPGRVVLGYSEVWPSETLSPRNPIYTQFSCGYGTKPSDVPFPIRHAMMMFIGHLYENREAFLSGTFGGQIQEVPSGFYQILEQYRTSRFGI